MKEIYAKQSENKKHGKKNKTLEALLLWTLIQN